MTDAKHETPAEGAGEWHCGKCGVAADERHDCCEVYEEQRRARSSAPESREEALGNLLAVIHGDGGHRALEVGTKQAALEAEKIVARLLSSAPEAREGEAVAGAALAKAMWGIDLVPAAPSADKLRIAVEALEKTRKLVSDASSTGFTDQDSVRALFVNNGALTRALAVLESGAK